MNNAFLPEETPEERTPAPIVSSSEPASDTETSVENALPTAEQTALLRELKRLHSNRSTAFAVSVIAAIVFFSLVLPLLFRLPPHLPGAGGRLETALALTFAAGWLWSVKGRKPLLTNAHIRQIEGAGAVGPLLDIVGYADYEIDKAAVYAALTLCLLRVKPGVAVFLTAPRHKQLLKSLRENAYPDGTDIKRPDFCIATLKALEQIGDASAVPLVKKIAGLAAYTSNEKHVRDAARQCLPLLKIRAGMMAESQTLLRASAPEQAGRATLLRPASGGTDTAPQELLRPSDGGNSAGKE